MRIRMVLGSTIAEMLPPPAQLTAGVLGAAAAMKAPHHAVERVVASIVQPRSTRAA